MTEVKSHEQKEGWVRICDPRLSKREVKLPQAPGGPPPLSMMPELKNSLTVRRNGLQSKHSKMERLPKLPPPLLLTPTFDQILRFKNSAASAKTVTIGELANACGGIAATAVLFFPWSSTIRIKAIHIWPAVSGTNTSPLTPPNQCSLNWLAAASAGYLPEDEKDQTIPAGVTVTRPGKFGPPKGSLANNWLGQALASEALFSIQAPIGSVVDVHVLCRMSNDLSPFPSAVISGGTPGLSYWGSLEGTGVYAQVGRPSVSGI
jgi:hypothetical protein